MLHFTVHAASVTDIIFKFNMVQPSAAVTALFETWRKIIFFEQAVGEILFLPSYLLYNYMEGLQNDTVSRKRMLVRVYFILYYIKALMVFL
jgi:hypothetical protein